MPAVSRLAEARGDSDYSNTLRRGFETFSRSLIRGATLDWAEEIPGLTEKKPQLEKGIGRTITEIAGELAGGIPTVAAGSLGIGAILGAAGMTGPLVPVLAGTLSAMTYEALRKAEPSDKAMGVALAAVGGGIAAKLRLRSLAKIAARGETGAAKEAVEKAVRFGGNLSDYVGADDTGKITKELTSYAAQKGLKMDRPAEVISAAVADFQKAPSAYGGQLKNTITAVTKNILEPDGTIKNEFLQGMTDVTSEVQKIQKQVFMNLAEQAGLEASEKFESSALGKTIGMIRHQFGDPRNIVSERPGGSVMLSMVDNAVIQKNAMNSEALKFMSPVAKQWSKIIKKNPKEANGIAERVSQALEDRTNAAKYVKPGFEMDLFKSYEGRINYWREQLEKRGHPTIDNYYTHMRDVIRDPKGTVGKSFPQGMGEAFLKERTGVLKDFVRHDIEKVFNTYENWVSRKLAYDPVVKHFYEGPQDAVVGKFISNVIGSRRVPGGIVDTMASIKYQNYIKRNWFSAFSNRSQVAMARAQVSPEAKKLGYALASSDDPRLVNFFEQRFSHFAEDILSENILTDMKKTGKLKGWLLNAFETSEAANWRDSRAMGLAQEVANNPTYQKMVKNKTGIKEAAMHVLFNDPQSKITMRKGFEVGSLMERAMRRGEDLAMGTQFSTTQGYKPALFEAASENPALRLPLQFQRFQASQLGSVWNLLVQQGKGQELSILRRGFQDEVNVVERFRAMKNLHTGLDKLKVDKTMRGVVQNMKTELKEDIGFLRDEVNRIEPRSRLRSSMEVGKMIVTGAAPKLARTWLKWGLVGYLFNKEYTKAQKQKDVGLVVGGQIPGLEIIRGQDLNPRYIDPKYGLVAGTVGFTPGVGLVDTLLPGRPITRGIHGALFGKKKKEKKETRTRYR